MSPRRIRRLLPDLPDGVLAMLDPARGPLEAPLRADLVGGAGIEDVGRALARQHGRARTSHAWRTGFFPRLRDNVRMLREAHALIARHAKVGFEITPAGEWLLDNFHLVEAQLAAVREGLPSRYFRDLPIVEMPGDVELPRVYGLAWAFVGHTDSAFDEELLSRFLGAYQESQELQLGELWALPTTLRVVLVESLRLIAETVATAKAARELAHAVADRIDAIDDAAGEELLELVQARGVRRAYALQLYQRLRGEEGERAAAWRERMRAALQDPGEAQSRQQAEQAANNLTVSSIIRSLRAVAEADWQTVVDRQSAAIRVLRASEVFDAESDPTRGTSLAVIERLARKSRRRESAVAAEVVALIQAEGDPLGASAAPAHWLEGAGRPRLNERLGLPPGQGRWRARLAPWALPAYLTLVIGASLVIAGAQVLDRDLAPAGVVLLFLLALVPASEAVVATVNRLISESMRPARLPRLRLASGISPGQRTLVVIPCMLSSEATIAQLARQLELHYLANPEAEAQFALLSDFADAASADQPEDRALLASAAAAMRDLELRHPSPAAAPNRFLLLHRTRRESRSEGAWIGWERKRGKIEQLLALLAEGEPGDFVDLQELSRPAARVRFVVTLDSDTRLPPGQLRELVSVAAHPANVPRIDRERGIVTEGYGILQPRVATPLPDPERATLYHALFAGQCGIDPYSVASSEIYQDVFGEGTFTGKGLLDVAAVHALLAGRLPDEQVLSHDLLEGSICRCASVSDVTLVEDAPVHPDVAASRLHRWTRGDWQLLPFLLRPRRWPLAPVNRWKMIDNLRRSLLAPASLALLLAAVALGHPSPVAAVVLILVAYGAGPLLGAVAGLAPHRDDVALRHFFHDALRDVARAIGGSLWGLALLLRSTLTMGDAIVRALHRTFVSRRRMLQWTTAAAAERSATRQLGALLRQHAPVTAVALFLLPLLALAGAVGRPLEALALCLLWAATPLAIWLGSRPMPGSRNQPLQQADADYLHDLARDTWRLFERHVGPEDNHLPPDNVQTMPSTMVARRTSPTNIGLYLLATACAQRFGWIGIAETIDRLEATLGTLDRLERHHGHFLNWYDTATLAPLPPLYVSTVDSGNLCGHLLGVAEACRALAARPADGGALARTAIARSARRLDGHRPLLATLWPSGAVPRLLALPDPVGHMRSDPKDFAGLLAAAAAQLDAFHAAGTIREGGADDGEPPTEVERTFWCLRDHLSTLRSQARDVRVLDAGWRLARIAARCRALALEADFSLVYHRRRRLMHIGWRVAERQLDASFYDLLASEARLASLVAIAKGDVPLSHWVALGRPAYAARRGVALRSWSGSMFEYLMPTLVLDEPAGSLLRSAACAAVGEQIAYARARQVPWGISECAVAERDRSLAYQYGPQGVPRLALRRTPSDELVVAPYATVLALQIDAEAALANLRRLEAAGARGAMGFIESLDFSPKRQPSREGDAEGGSGGMVRVCTFMAHHQGMSLLAVADRLLDAAPRRWCMAEPLLDALGPLLHERIPREVSALAAPPPASSAPAAEEALAPRDVAVGDTALAPTHLLTNGPNGRYTVALRPNGAGFSRIGAAEVHRVRDDLLRDLHGTFLYLRRRDGAPPVSLTRHPAPDPRARYGCRFHPDSVVFDARFPDLASRCTVWVSPEDDVEFRRVELQNLGDAPLSLELFSFFEASLAPARADEAHPAFANLFVGADWQPADRALYLERRARLATEAGLHAVHFVARADALAGEPTVQTDRAQWIGRHRDASDPLAAFPAEPVAGEQVTGLDPVASICCRLVLAPQTVATVIFATAAGSSRDAMRQIVDKVGHRVHVDRAAFMSNTLCAIRLREMQIGAESLEAIQWLTTLAAMTATREGPPPGTPLPHCDRRLLWRFGISGDWPIVHVAIESPQGVGLVRTLGLAVRLWAAAGMACDVVVVNDEAGSYWMPVQRELDAIAERAAAEAHTSRQPPTPGGLRVLRAGDLSEEERQTLHALARVRLVADGRPLGRQMKEILDEHEAARREREERRATVLGPAWPRALAGTAPIVDGRFAPDDGRFEFAVDGGSRTARPWVNVLANAGFGTIVSEAGGGTTWAGNSRMHQLTPWSNDPVSDTAGEWCLLQDLESGRAWNVTPGRGAAGAAYRVCHGPGWTTIRHETDALQVEATWCVDPERPLRQLALTLTHRGGPALALRIVAMVEWILGATRAERVSVITAASGDDGTAPRSPPPRDVVLTATQCDRHSGFGGATAFLAAATGDAGGLEWTCDRREFFDARGRVAVPARLGRASGAGLDPCAALALQVQVERGASVTVAFLLGHGDSRESALQTARLALAQPPSGRLQAVRTHWDAVLGKVSVRTPDPLFDVLVNRWLVYQTVACRMWARAGFYQAGGAFGYRDQLQDAMALAAIVPQWLRRQILVNASRQYPEGDVQHWWHPPGGAGVRTHFSDDRLWLVLATLHYLQTTGDRSLLDEPVHFIEGAPVPEGAEDIYETPTVGRHAVPLYEHGARALDRSLAVGRHGLPLIGTGDWNDGMNRVGHHGQGESVWVGWFLCHLVEGYAPLAEARGDAARAARWRAAAGGWRAALHDEGWDGRWFRRAFFDDGTPLGSAANAECRIDLIAQAWAVISGAAEPARAREAMAAAREHLFDDRLQLVRLLDPPLAHAEPSAGYIQAYPPGIRENGGQYSHAGVWAVIAAAELGENDLAYRWFRGLSPAHRAADPALGPLYRIEPYVMAGDVYAQAPYAGRGGWSWYTGSAGWMHRAAVETIVGLQLRGRRVAFRPHLPSGWDRVEVELEHDGVRHRFVIATGIVAADGDDAPPLAIGEEIELGTQPLRRTVRVSAVPGRASAPATAGAG